MALATEVAVVNGTTQVTDATNKIGEILRLIDELDRKAEKYLNPNSQDAIDGFFVRDDISGPSDPRLGGRFREVKSDFQNPQEENASPSGDQIFGLMYGLLCVVEYSGDTTLISQARAISSRLYDYARRSFFDLKLPNGNTTRRGSDMRWLSSLLHGLNKSITREDHFNESQINVGPFALPLNGIAAFWDDDGTPATIARLAGQSFHFPFIGSIALNSFALHIMLMALAPSEIWSQPQLEDVALKSNHHLSTLWYCQLHDTKPQSFDKSTIQSILDACPEEGPKASLPAASGWQHDNRWVRCTNIFDATGGAEEFNGIDWLLLNNLSLLVYNA